jgi:hypothetical protein
MTAIAVLPVLLPTVLSAAVRYYPSAVETG